MGWVELIQQSLEEDGMNPSQFFKIIIKIHPNNVTTIMRRWTY